MHNPGGQQPGGNMQGARQGYAGQQQQQQQQQNSQQAPGYSNQPGIASQHQGMQQYSAAAAFQGRPMQQGGATGNAPPAGWQGYNGAQGSFPPNHYQQQQGAGALPQGTRQQPAMHAQQPQQQQYPQQQQQQQHTNAHLQHAAALQQQQQQQVLQHQQALQALQQQQQQQQQQGASQPSPHQQLLLLQQLQAQQQAQAQENAAKRARLENSGIGSTAGSVQQSTPAPQGLNLGNGATGGQAVPPRPASAGLLGQPQARPQVSTASVAGLNPGLSALLAAQQQRQPMGPPAPVRPKRTEEDQWVLPRRGVQMAMQAVGLEKDFKIDVGAPKPPNVDASSKAGSELQGGLMELYSNLIENAVQVGASTARARKSSVLKPRDMAVYLERTWGIHVPGFAAEQLKPHRRATSSDVHRQRVVAVRNTTQQQDAPGGAAGAAQDAQQDGNGPGAAAP